MFNCLRVANLLWIVWSMVVVEITLNYNHVKEVLGPGNRIFFPSQLIPLIIGCFSIIRLGYKVLKKWRDPDDDPSLPVDPRTSGTRQEFPPKFRIFKLFAPPTDVLHAAPGPLRHPPPRDGDIDRVMEAAPVRLRYLVSWLPWLSLLHWWQKGRGGSSNLHRHTNNLEKGRPHSPASTLQGTPTMATFVNPYEPEF